MIGITASAPAKIILFGEHFVVYGEPALVMAIERRAYATVNLRNDQKICVLSRDLEMSATFKNAPSLERISSGGVGVILRPIAVAAQKSSRSIKLAIEQAGGQAFVANTAEEGARLETQD